MSHSFTQNCSDNSASFTTWRTKNWCPKVKVKKKYFLRRLEQFHGLTWLTPTSSPLFCDRYATDLRQAPLQQLTIKANNRNFIGLSRQLLDFLIRIILYILRYYRYTFPSQSWQGSHFMTHDPRDPSINWPVTRVTRDPWLLTSHCHSVTCHHHHHHRDIVMRLFTV